MTTMLTMPMRAAETEAAPRVKRWTKRDFNRLVDCGGLEGWRIFLFRGELIEMPSMGPLHAVGVSRATRWLTRTFDAEFVVRIQLPFATPGETIPQPDGAVVTEDQAERLSHPTIALMQVEVSDRSVELDREKAFDYAAAMVPDYWLLNMRDREIEVFRDPVADPTTPTTFRYASRRVYREGESVAPLARPEAAVAVSALVAAPR